MRAGVAALVVATMAICAVSACNDDQTTPAAAATTGPNAKVVRVVDGDTIVAEIDGQVENVRLIGIDTPESVKPNSPVECFGHEASARTKQLLTDGTRVRLVRDREARDRYGRLLAYVYRASDGLFVNLAMVADGYANQYTFQPNVAHVAEFREAVRTARTEGRGVWSACRGELPFPADQH